MNGAASLSSPEDNIGRQPSVIDALRDRLVVIIIVFLLAFLVVSVRLISLALETYTGFFLVMTIWFIVELYFHCLLSPRTQAAIIGNHYYKMFLDNIFIRLPTISHEVAAHTTQRSLRGAFLILIANAYFYVWALPIHTDAATVAYYFRLVSLVIIFAICLYNVFTWVRVVRGYFGFNPEEATKIAIYLIEQKTDKPRDSGGPRPLMNPYPRQEDLDSTDLVPRAVR